MPLKDQLKQAADDVRKKVDEAVAADDALTKTVDSFLALATGLPFIGGYAQTAKAIVDGQDSAADAVKVAIDLADDAIDKL